jgi:hypothetical protein
MWVAEGGWVQGAKGWEGGERVGKGARKLPWGEDTAVSDGACGGVCGGECSKIFSAAPRTAPLLEQPCSQRGR